MIKNILKIRKIIDKKRIWAILIKGNILLWLIALLNDVDENCILQKHQGLIHDTWKRHKKGLKSFMTEKRAIYKRKAKWHELENKFAKNISCRKRDNNEIIRESKNICKEKKRKKMISFD